MDFSWTDKQIELKNKVIKFAKASLNGEIFENDNSSFFSIEKWKKCAEFGIQSFAASKELQKQKIDIITSVLAMEGFGYGCRDNGLAFALNAQMWTVQLPIAHFGNEEQKQRFLKPLIEGNAIASHALTEPEAGSDVFSMKTSAKKTKGGYILNGKKQYITLGPIADFALVFAVTNPDVGKWGISAFIVEKGTKGYTQSSNKQKMGMRTVPFGDLIFKDCFIPEENRLGKEGAGWSITNHSLELDRCFVFASQLGAMGRQLEDTINYVKERKQFGKTIGSFQSVSNRVAEMKLRLESSRLLLYKVAWLKNEGKSAMLESSLLKLHISESFALSSIDAIRNYGGYGYISKNEIERDLRDAIGGVIYAGTSDIQKNIIANILGL